MADLVAWRRSGVTGSVRRDNVLRRPTPRAYTIDQANKLLKHRFDLDGAQAVSVLVQMSKKHNESLEAVAHLLLTSEEPDEQAQRN